MCRREIVDGEDTSGRSAGKGELNLHRKKETELNAWRSSPVND